MQRLIPWTRAWLAPALTAFAFLAPAHAFAAVLGAWDVHGMPGGPNDFGPASLPATTTAANVAIGALTRGSGVGTTGGSGAARGWGGNDWQNGSANAAVSGNDIVTFSVTPAAGFNVSFSSLSRLDYRRSATGAASGVLQVQVGGGAFIDVATLSYGVTASSGGSIGAINLSPVAALQNVPGGTTVTFRIANYGGSSSAGTWYVFDVANSTAADLEISGSVQVGDGVVNGACGSSNGQSFASVPTANFCAVGTPSAVTGPGPWAWSCAGSGGGTTASCAASKSSGAPFTVFHMNDVHARLTPHKWVINQHGSRPDAFEDVGGAAYLAGKLLSLVGNEPTALVLDGGDISEGNPVGDMNCTQPPGGGTPVCSNNGYGNGGMTAFYAMLQAKLAAVGGARGTRGIDALVVGNHDVRDISYIQNMEHMRDAGVPVISINVRDIATHQPHFAPYTTVTVNGVKVGIVGYTTSSATVGASLASTLEVVDCQWTGSSVCNLSTYVNELRNNLHCDVVILLTHDGHSDLVDPLTPVIADTNDAKVPEIAVTGHWHTWAETVWQPDALNYKTIFTESSSYMKYIGELHVSATGGLLGTTQHVLRNADITPDPDVKAYVDGLIAQYNASSPDRPVTEVVGYTNDALELDNRMKWWSADEYPWSGNNTAGQWITDGMKWKCDHIAWASGGGCDLAIEAGGGVRADIPAGPVTFLQVYETFPWADDLYVRVNMTGQDIINFLNATNLDTGFSREMDVTAFDGIVGSVLINGQPIGLTTTYKVAINNYMLAHPPGGYVWPATVAAETDPSNTLVRDSLMEFMRQAHGTPAAAYSVGGSRYHFNGEYSGAYRAVVTMTNDDDTRPVFENVFIRLLSANDETLARRGSRQVPTNLVNADGSVDGGNRLSEQELYRSFLGFRKDALQPGDIVEVWGKAAFFEGNPEFVDQEGVYGDGQEFKIVGHDDGLAAPAYVPSISALLTDPYKNHYVRFLARKATGDSVVDQNGQMLKIWDRTAFTAASLPGAVGGTLELTGVPTMESYGYRFRSATIVPSAAALPAPSEATSHVNAVTPEASAPIALSATAGVGGVTYTLNPAADAQVAGGSASSNFGTSTNIFLQGTTASGTFGIERGWLKFDLSAIPGGSAVSGATLQLYNWRSSGPAMPVEARAVSTDTWTETGINYGNQPALGAVLDTQTLAANASNVWYGWNVTSFVQSQVSGDRVASLMVKAVDESQAGGPSYGFDAKEFGSNAPVLTVTTQPSASSVASVGLFYRYSADGTTFGAWTPVGAALTTAPYTTGFSFPNGVGHYEFYSVATDNLGHVETAPPFAQSRVHYQAASGAPQGITFGALPPAPVGSSIALSATASSGLPVAYSSLTTSTCSTNGSQVTALALGTCTVAADQPGNVGVWFAAERVTQSFSVTKLPQSISFPAFGALTVGGQGTLSATASSGLAVQLTSQTATVCSVSGNTVNALQVGTCTVAADQPGDAFFDVATTVLRSVEVNGQAQTISFAAIADRTFESGGFVVSASASSGLTVTIAAQTPSVCAVNAGGQVSLLAAGTCTLAAHQAGNSTYAAAPAVLRSFNVTGQTSSGGDDGGDAPLPPWFVALLAIGLAGALHTARRKQSMKMALTALLAALALGVVAPAARAAAPESADPGIYGPLDIAKLPKPTVHNAKAVVANADSRRKTARAIYVHLPPGQEAHWQSHCRVYSACDVPVHFVTEGWFAQVYLPAIGRQDGREQRYLMQQGRTRDQRRELHHSRGDD